MQGDIKREWFDTDYYAVLGVAKDASSSDITKAYRKLARENHPDTNPGDSAAEERFKGISAAYEVVGDDDKRASYDQARAIGPMGGGFGSRSGGGGGGGGFGFEGADLGDILGSVFGGGQGGTLFGDQPGGRYARIKRPGQDQEAGLEITFDEAVRGTTTSLSVTDRDGPRTIKIRIPAGVEAGKRMRLRGKGGPGDPRGDLYVIIEVGTHPIFGRRGDRLTIDLPVTFAEAALGADVAVPTYSGDSVTMRVPAGTQHGRTLRVRGAGAQSEHGEPGDLLVTINVAVPLNLSKKQRAAIEALAALDDESPRKHLGTS